PAPTSGLMSHPPSSAPTMPTTMFSTMPCCPSVRITRLASHPITPPITNQIRMFINVGFQFLPNATCRSASRHPALALTLDVKRGSIGGWAIAAFALSYTACNSCLTRAGAYRQNCARTRPIAERVRRGLHRRRTGDCQSRRGRLETPSPPSWHARCKLRTSEQGEHTHDDFGFLARAAVLQIRRRRPAGARGVLRIAGGRDDFSGTPRAGARELARAHRSRPNTEGNVRRGLTTRRGRRHEGAVSKKSLAIFSGLKACADEELRAPHFLVEAARE